MHCLPFPEIQPGQFLKTNYSVQVTARHEYALASSSKSQSDTLLGIGQLSIPEKYYSPRKAFHVPARDDFVLESTSKCKSEALLVFGREPSWKLLNMRHSLHITASHQFLLESFSKCLSDALLAIWQSRKEFCLLNLVRGPTTPK